MLLVLILYVELFIISLLLDGKWYSLRVQFYFVWSLIFILYNLRIFDLYEESQLADIIFALTGIFFFAGTVSSNRFHVTKHSHIHFNASLKKNLFILFVLISIISLFRGSINSIRGLLSGETFLSMSYKVQFRNYGVTGIWVFFTYFIVNPLTYSIIPIAVYRWIKNHDLKLLCASMAILILFVLYRGERGPIFLFILSYLLMFYLDRRETSLNGPSPIDLKTVSSGLAMIIFLIGGVSLINAITNSRGISNANESWYYYFCGCIPYLSYKLRTITEYTYGGASCLGIINPPILLLHGLRILDPFPNWYNKLLSLTSTSEFYKIGSGSKAVFNAFVGPAYYFYLDFGILGVIFGTFILGYIYQKIFINMMRNRRAKDYCLYMISAYGIIFSLERNWFFHGSYIIGFIYIIFFMGLYDEDIRELYRD